MKLKKGKVGVVDSDLVRFCSFRATTPFGFGHIVRSFYFYFFFSQ